MSRNMILLIQTLAKVEAKKKFGLCLIARLRGKLLHFSFIQKFHHGGVFLGPVIEYLFVQMIAQSRTIPAQSLFFTAQLPPKTCTIFFFFLHPVRRPVYLYRQQITIFFIFAKVGKSWLASNDERFLNTKTVVVCFFII